MEYIEVSAKTIDDALTEASIKLGTTSDKLEYEVIDKGSNGFLGIGSRDAVIKVKKAEASVEDEIREFLDSVFKAMKLEVTIDIKVDEDNRNVDVELNGPEMGVLIGKRGQTLDSLQYLTNLAINKQSENYYRVKIDTEDYRKRRRETLENLAKNISFKVKRFQVSFLNIYYLRIFEEFHMQNDTIAAIATAMSPSGIGIIRISGDDALSVIDRIYKSKNNKKKISACQSHTIHYGFIYDGDEKIDEVMVLLMKAPNTYTREDTVEIDCHGGVYVMKRVLEAVIKNGARPAEPGEFTKRAFLNGRIDLSQAESVIDVINSKNDFALKSSLSQLGGAVLGSIRQIREQLLHEIAFIESALDDPEHISLDGYPQKLRAIVDNEYVEIDSLLKTSDNGRILKEGINTVIIGKPNAGKSSLLNVLVGSDRAIVTDIAGTTRDVLEEQINIGGITLNLVDTAGIRSTEDVVEKIGVKKAMEHANEADLIIYVVDSSVVLDDNDYDIINFIKDKKAVILLNKSDLASKVSADDIKKLVDKTVISVSAKESLGIDELSDTIKEMFFDGQVSFNDEIYITNIRHKKLLSDAKESLKLVMNSIDDDMPEDFYSIDLMSAYESLGLIIGESVEDDLMDEIFSKFCMGK